MANFGGFLSEQYRMNDWWWGRIDAARSLSSALSHDVGIVADRAADLVMQQREVDVLPATAPELTASIGGLDRLRGNYRYGIVSQLFRIMGRALPGKMPSMSGMIMWLLLFCIRPVLIFVPGALPLVGQLSRFLAAVTVLAAAVVLASPSAPDPGAVAGADPGAVAEPVWVGIWAGISAVILVALTIWWIVGAAVADRKWGVVEAAAAGMTFPTGINRPQAFAAVSNLRRRSRAHSSSLPIVAALACIGFAALALSREELALAVVSILVAVLLTHLSRTWLTTVRASQPIKREWGWTVVATLGVAALVVAEGLRVVAPMWKDSVPISPFLWTAGGMFACAVILLAGWLSWWHVAWVAFVAVSPLVLLAIVLVVLPAIGLYELPDIPEQPVTTLVWLWIAAILWWANFIWLVPAWVTLFPTKAQADRLLDLI